MNYYFVHSCIKNNLHHSMISVCEGYVKLKLIRKYSMLIYFNTMEIVDWKEKVKRPRFLGYINHCVCSSLRNSCTMKI